MGDRSNELIRQLIEVPVHAIGTVLDGNDPEQLRVSLPQGECVARRAASCLLLAQPGDRVLVSGPNASALYVIAVLETASVRPCQLALGQDAEISVSGKLSLATDELVVLARRATTMIDQLSSFGRELSASIGKLKLVGNLLETFFDRVGHFAGHSVRTVEGVDQARSGTIDYRATQSLSLQGSEIIATAKTLVKVDGGQIHIG
jgi:hypothetical protein